MIALTCMGVIRSIVLGLTTVLFAVNGRHWILQGQLAWVVLIPIYMGVIILFEVVAA